ncbi:hypothetical protein F5Y16DRAFT_424912 [Xylariaceae sp. FL0255]|nr:hypothetical protein F5Y16DRAFT_424912 [Xylariaceae sp. FL0255]
MPVTNQERTGWINTKPGAKNFAEFKLEMYSYEYLDGVPPDQSTPEDRSDDWPWFNIPWDGPQNRNVDEAAYCDEGEDHGYCTVEPLSNELLRLVPSQLGAIFYERMAEVLQSSDDGVNHGWHQVPIICGMQFREYVDHDWRTVPDSRQPYLSPRAFTKPLHWVREDLLAYADNDFAVYFDSHPGRDNGYGMTRQVDRYIFREWFRYHDRRPPFLGHQKLAQGIEFRGSQRRDVQSFRNFHRSFCDEISIGLD